MKPLKDGFYHAKDVDIYYRIYGTGENIILLIHGNGEDWTCFKNQIEELSVNHTVITMDSRGHGRSINNNANITIKLIAKDAVGLLKFLQIKHVSLIGFSDGANVAMEMALNYSLKIDHLILAGGNLYPKGVKMKCQLPITLGYLLCRFIALFNKKAVHNAQILGLMVNEPNTKPTALSSITAPTLVIAGEHDIIKENHTKLIARSIPNAKLEIIPNAEHSVFDKWSKQTNRCILHFLSK